MRKMLSFIFWIMVTILYVANIAFLIYLICRSFGIGDVKSIEFLSWFNARGLLWLWLVYLFLAVPAVALLQYYGRNLANENISFPLLHTAFGVLGGFLKVLVIIAVLSMAIFLTVDVVIPLLQKRAESGEWDSAEIFGELQEGTVREVRALGDSVEKIVKDI